MDPATQTTTTKTNGRTPPPHKVNGAAGMPQTVSGPGQQATTTRPKKKAKTKRTTRAAAAPATATTKRGRPLAIFLGNQLAALGADPTTTPAQLDTYMAALNDAWPAIRRAA